MKNTKPFPRSDRPLPMGISNPSCPILQEARNVLDKAQDLHRAIRKLRRSTQRCLTCPERRQCPTTSYFAQAVDTAIRQLRREWGIDRD